MANEMGRAAANEITQLGLALETPAVGGGQAASELVPGNGSVEHSDDVRSATVAEKRATIAARVSILLTRLNGLGLHGVTTLKLMRTRRVMVSMTGSTLRVHEGFTRAPDDTLRALVLFATSRNKAARKLARETILAFEVETPPLSRRAERPVPGDLALVNVLVAEHRDLNAKFFDGALTTIAIRLSGRMASRLGHFDPGSTSVASEIALSRAHVVEHGWREASHTLLHEMVHQWQHETGRAVNHGTDFRRKCREVGITPAARRDLVPIRKRRRRRA